MIQINKNNVEYLWSLYEDYLEEFNQTHYSNVKPKYFEEMVEQMVYCENTDEYHWKDETFYCNNCNSYYLEEEKGESELALQDNICQYCIEDGYGK